MIVTSNRGGTCGICLDEFDYRDQPVTHIGGEGHDGFHKKCLADWVVRNPTCPYDRQPIDPKSLITRTDQIMKKLGSALTCSAYAASCGAVVGASGALTGALLARAGAIATGEAAAAAAALTAGIAGAEVVLRGVEVGALQVIAVTAALLGTKTALSQGVTLLGTKVAVVGAGLSGIGIVTGIGVDRVLNRRVIDRIDRENIGCGLCLGALAGTVALPFELSAAPTVIALVASFSAGILSITRK